MKVTITYSDDDGIDAAIAAIRGPAWEAAYHEVSETLRQWQKHRDDLDPKTLDIVRSLVNDSRPE